MKFELPWRRDPDFKTFHPSGTTIQVLDWGNGPSVTIHFWTIRPDIIKETFEGVVTTPSPGQLSSAVQGQPLTGAVATGVPQFETENIKELHCTVSVPPAVVPSIIGPLLGLFHLFPEDMKQHLKATMTELLKTA